MIANLLEARVSLGSNERGFSLMEVLGVVVIIGIVAGIAIPSWFSIVDSRRVDSATSQLTSDLRLANSRATNRGVDWEIVLPPMGGSSYCYKIHEVGDSTTPCKPLPASTQVNTTSQVTIKFSPKGSALVTPSSITNAQGISSIAVNSTTTASNSRTLKLLNNTSVVDTRGRL